MAPPRKTLPFPGFVRHFNGEMFTLGMILGGAVAALVIHTTENLSAVADNAPTYQLESRYIMGGELYANVIDHGLSLSDCETAAAMNGEGWACVIERVEPISVVGLGCEGATGPLYATDEDMLPVCDSVRPV